MGETRGLEGKERKGRDLEKNGGNEGSNWGN